MENVGVASSYAAQQPKGAFSNPAFFRSILPGLLNSSARAAIRSFISKLIQSLTDKILTFSFNAISGNYKATLYAINISRSLTFSESLFSRLQAAAESSNNSLHSCCEQLSQDVTKHLPHTHHSGFCTKSIRAVDLNAFFQIFARTFAMAWEISSSD
jgi:hypothetical protein